jgi:hypothetical protein
MNQVQTFSDVPADKLDELVKNLECEVPRNAIEVTRQINGMWQVRVLVEQNTPASGSAVGSESNASATRPEFKQRKF